MAEMVRRLVDVVGWCLEKEEVLQGFATTRCDEEMLRPFYSRVVPECYVVVVAFLGYWSS